MKNIVLIGFMGSGKDTIGKILAKKTGMHYVSIDKAVELSMKLKIPDIFGKLGESRFRKEENKVVRNIKDIKGCIISTGGGTVVNNSNRKILKKAGKVVHLKTSLQSITKRLKNRKGRPLLNDIGVEILFRRRHDTYSFADITVTTDNQGPQSTAKQILCATNSIDRKPGKLRTTRIDTAHYPVIIGHNIINKLNDYTRPFISKNARTFIVTDNTTAYLYLNTLLNQLKNAEYTIIPCGENSKSIKTATGIYDFLSSHNADRNDTLVALGGGVTGDIAGFIASTYKRGMKLVHIPTTLLAQVDSSVGGKTGINRRDGKNMIGTFYNPELIITDISTLQTLPDREFSNGIAEVVKYALIKDRPLFQLLQEKQREISARATELLAAIVSKCVKIKSTIVEKDQKETMAYRELLNFGHTIGHAIETATRYKKYTHGEAISIGMVAETTLCRKLGFRTDPEQVSDLLRNYRLPTKFPEGIGFRQLINPIVQDKKIRGGYLNLPVIIKTGASKVYRIKLETFKKLAKTILIA